MVSVRSYVKLPNGKPLKSLNAPWDNENKIEN